MNRFDFSTSNQGSTQALARPVVSPKVTSLSADIPLDTSSVSKPKDTFDLNANSTQQTSGNRFNFVENLVGGILEKSLPVQAIANIKAGQSWKDAITDSPGFGGGQVENINRRIELSQQYQKEGMSKEDASKKAFLVAGGERVVMGVIGATDAGAGFDPIKAIAGSKDTSYISEILRQQGVAPDLIPSVSQKLASVSTESEAASALSKVARTQATTKLATEGGNIADQLAPDAKDAQRLVGAQKLQELNAGPKLPEVATDQLATDRAFADTVENLDKGGFKGFSQDLKNSYQDWVNQRNASKVAGLKGKQAFKELDQLGVDGIFKFQEGNATGRLADVKTFFDTTYQKLQDAGIELNYKKNYLPQLWANTPEEINLAFDRKLGLRPSFTLDSIIATYKEGIDKGLTPKFTNVSDLVGWYEQRANKALADKSFFDYLTKNNFIQPGGNAPLGWKTLNPDNFPFNKLQYGGKEYMGAFKAPPDLADVINNYLSIPDGPVASFANFASYLKNIVLSSGIPKTGINAHGINILVRNTLASKNPISGFLKGSYYLVNPAAAENFFLKNLDSAQFAVSHGLSLSSEEHAIDALEGNVVKRGFGKLKQIQNNLFEKPLFNKVIPAVKLQHFNTIYEDLARNMPDKEAAQAAAKITNNLFGGINWEQFGRQRETQNLLRSFFLAPDWAEGQIRTGGGVIKGLLKPTSPAGQAYRRVARNLLLAYTSANVLNKVTSGHWMWENASGHTFQVEMGKDATKQVRYLTPFGTAADFVRIPYDVALSLAKGDLSQVFRVIRNRLSIPGGTAFGLVTNTDYLGRPLVGNDRYGKPMPVAKQVAGVASEVAGLVTPQYGQALIDLVSGRSSAEQAGATALELPLKYSQPPKSKSTGSGNRFSF